MKNIRPSRPTGERATALSPFVLVAHLLVTFIAFLGLLMVDFLPDQISLEEGMVSPDDVFANKQVEIRNEKATDEARRRAARAVEEKYVQVPEVATIGAKKLEDTFLALDQAESLKEAPENKLSPEQLEELAARLPVRLTSEDLTALLALDPDDRFLLQNGVLHIFYRLMDADINEGNIRKVREQTEVELRQELTGADPTVQPILVRLINEAIQVNQQPSKELTRKAQQEAMANVQPIVTVIPKGAKVVSKGELVTDDDIKTLEALGLYKPRLKWSQIGGLSLLVLAGMGLLYGYMATYRRDLLAPRYIMVLGVVLITTGVMCRLLLGVSPYLAPVAVASVLITTLMDRRLAMLVTGVLALFVGVMVGSMEAFGVSYLTGVVGVLALSRVDSRSQLISATLLVGLANMIAVMAFELVAGIPMAGLVEGVGFGLLNGFLSGWVAVGALPMFEQFSGITTHFRLLDLSHMNEPLLRRLTLEAPGTYQHSMMVANLAEQAARSIGADALLCRVGAYYHDIGKMKRPRFFIENQMGLENPHDKLAPSLSTRIIHSHVKDGIEMAREAKLPDILVDFIAQHHGTSLVGYFYHQACARSTEPVFEEDFRYPGPKPQTRETAILMLCDGLEAAARTLSQPTPEKLADLVNKMVKHNLDDGQLDDCGLSLRDIKIVKETLSRSLQGIYHSRIEYPDAAPPRRKVTQLRRKGS